MLDPAHHIFRCIGQLPGNDQPRRDICQWWTDETVSTGNSRNGVTSIAAVIADSLRASERIASAGDALCFSRPTPRSGASAEASGQDYDDAEEPNVHVGTSC
jgi:hypothetical protein